MRLEKHALTALTRSARACFLGCVNGVNLGGFSPPLIRSSNFALTTLSYTLKP